MKHLFSLVLLFLLTACGQSPQSDAPAVSVPPAPEVSAPVVETVPEPLPEPDPVQERLDSMTLEQKLGQLFFVRCPTDGGAALAASDRCPGGFLLFGQDFENRTKQQVIDRISAFQSAAQTPLLIGADEEGGTVVRVSRYFREEKFRSPRALYRSGGLEAILADTTEKDAFLASFGINVNLAPVADLSTDSADFIYPRALGEDAETTAAYIAAVVKQMNTDGMGSVLKHFPGYGSNIDTHTDRAVDDRPLTVFEGADLLPFIAGIEADAPCVLVSHNIVPAFGDELPGSMSPAIVCYLRETLAFEGVVMTDDLAMAAAAYENAAVRAVQAGCDLLITSDYETQYAEVLAAVQAGELTEAKIDAAAYRVLAWKQVLGLF